MHLSFRVTGGACVGENVEHVWSWLVHVSVLGLGSHKCCKTYQCLASIPSWNVWALVYFQGRYQVHSPHRRRSRLDRLLNRSYWEHARKWTISMFVTVYLPACLIYLIVTVWSLRVWRCCWLASRCFLFFRVTSFPFRQWQELLIQREV